MSRHWQRHTAWALLLGWAGGLWSAPVWASVEAERELGRKFALQAQAQLPLVTDVEVVGYVNRIGQRIVSGLDANPFPYTFFVVRDGKINAFAVPGGYIYVHSGLLTRVVNDDELAGVLGHEIAHVHAHHLARQQEATQFMNYAALLGVLLSVVQPALGAGAIAASAAVQLKYRREFEQEADYLGAGYMRQAGFAPTGMLDFFKKLADEQRLSPTFLPPYLQSHPLNDQRLNNLEAVLRTRQWAGGARRSPSATLLRVQVLAHAHTENPSDVLATYRRLVDAHPADAQARYLLGVAFIETGAFESARQTLEQARDLGWTAADRELGRTWLHLRQPEKARALLSRAVEVDPDDAGAHHELAQALEALGDTAAAMREYERALELAPTLEAAHYGLGILAGRTGHEGDGYFHLAEAFRLRGEYDKALHQYEKARPLLATGSPRAEYVQTQIDELTDFIRQNRSLIR